MFREWARNSGSFNLERVSRLLASEIGFDGEVTAVHYRANAKHLEPVAVYRPKTATTEFTPFVKTLGKNKVACVAVGNPNRADLIDIHGAKDKSETILFTLYFNGRYSPINPDFQQRVREHSGIITSSKNSIPHWAGPHEVIPVLTVAVTRGLKPRIKITQHRMNKNNLAENLISKTPYRATTRYAILSAPHVDNKELKEKIKALFEN